MRQAAWLLALCLLGACVRQRGEDEQLLALYARLDDGWAPPGTGGEDGSDQPDLARLREDLQTVTEARTVRPADPELAWRHARVLVGLGVLEDDALGARRLWAQARSVATACATAGATSVEVGIDAVVEERVPCVAWAVDGWTRWSRTWDTAAVAMDRGAITNWLDTLPTAGDGMVPTLARASWKRLRGVDAPIATP